MNPFNPNHKTALDKLLLRMPAVSEGSAFGYPAYIINDEPFAFVTQNGIALRLPEPRIRQLVSRNNAMRWFEPVEGMIWGDWMAVQRVLSSDYWLDIGLFEEALEFVLEREFAYNR